MSAVSAELLQTIKELQSLPSLTHAILGGGTNLAIRFSHRQSIDIDFFFSGIIGKAGFLEIEKQVKDYYKDRIFGLSYPCDESDQFTFMRFFVRINGGNAIKVELMQNANFVDVIEELQGVRMASICDIGLLKLMAVANRASQKDVYDLDYITELVPLAELMDLLKSKREKFCSDQHKTIFDLDGEISPIENPLLLLKFEETALVSQSRPGHAEHRVVPMKTQKNWQVARSSYRSKIRKYFGQKGIDFPSIAPLN